MSHSIHIRNVFKKTKGFAILLLEKILRSQREQIYAPKNTLITILGSCRQSPISSYFPVTSIRDTLNYPHYTKEILQEIKYLKYRSLSSSATQYCFRDSLLKNCTSTIGDQKFLELQQEFFNTDIFLIEIASRISYEWNDIYLHHIAEEPEYSFPFRGEIKKRLLSDEEIEADILEIRKELYPKKFIIVSHFSTYERGARYELIKILESICKKLEIPFINQSKILERGEIEELLVSEPILSHYTEKGNKLAGEILQQEVMKILPRKQEKFQIYYTDKERISKYTFHGFGDFLKGCMFLHQQSINLKFEAKVNFSHHLLNDFFCCSSYIPLEETKNARYIFRNEESVLPYQYIFTNTSPEEPLNKSCKDFIIKNCLTPRLGFENYLTSIKSKIGFDKYAVIHIRLSDNEVYDVERCSNIKKIIEEVQAKFEGNILLLSSNNIYDERLTNARIKTLNLQKAHLGLDDITPEAARDTLAEFMLLSSATKIFQISVYPWGSGFSEMAHLIFDIDLERFSI